MEPLDYATPAKPPGAGPKATAAVVAAVWAWLPLGLTCLHATRWAILLFPILSLLAVVLGHFARRESPPGPSTHRTRATIAMWVGIAQLGLVAVFVLLPSRVGSRESANRMKCASNLRQIGQGIQMYASEYGGLFPRCSRC